MQNLAERKLKDILKAREEQEASPPAIERVCKGALGGYKHVLPDWYISFCNKTKELQENLEANLQTAMQKMRQYEFCTNRRVPCQALIELVASYNGPGKFTSTYTNYTFYRDGTVKTKAQQLVNPGVFRKSELERRPVERRPV